MTTSFESKLQSILLPSEKYPSLTSDPEYLLHHLLPCTIPLVVALEFLRKLFDEEIGKHGLLAGAGAEGSDPILSFLKVLPVLKKAIKVLTSTQKKALKEEEYLNSISEKEKEYLLDMRIILKNRYEEIFEILEQESVDGEERCVGKRSEEDGPGEGAETDDDSEDEELDDKDRLYLKLTSSLKKSIIQHLELLQEISFEEFDKENFQKVKLGIKNFEITFISLEKLREKILDVDGKYSKPFRDKLESLNSLVLSVLDENNQKMESLEKINSDILKFKNEINILKMTNDLILKKQIQFISKEFEDFLFTSFHSLGTERTREENEQNLQYLTKECQRISEMIQKIKEEYQKLKKKLNILTEELSYSRYDARVQGVHTISSILEQQLSRNSLLSHTSDDVSVKSEKFLMKSPSASSSSSSSSLISSSSSTIVSHKASADHLIPVAAVASGGSVGEGAGRGAGAGGGAGGVRVQVRANEESDGLSVGLDSKSSLHLPSIHESDEIKTPPATNTLSGPPRVAASSLAAHEVFGLQHIIAHILGYLGDAEIEQFGAMTLDESIQADLLGGMKLVITQQQQQLELRRMKSLEREIQESIGTSTSGDAGGEDDDERSTKSQLIDEQLARAVLDIMNPTLYGPQLREEQESGIAGTSRRPNSRTTRELRRVKIEEGADISAFPKLLTSSDLQSSHTNKRESPSMIMTTMSKNAHTSASTAGTTFQRVNEMKKLSKRSITSMTAAATARKDSQRVAPNPSLALIVSQDHVVTSYVGTLGQKMDSTSTSNSASGLSSHTHSSSSLSQIQDSSTSSNQLLQDSTTFVLSPSPPPPGAAAVGVTNRKSSVGVLRRSIQIASRATRMDGSL
jgi:hypothetical protein